MLVDFLECVLYVALHRLKLGKLKDQFGKI